MTVCIRPLTHTDDESYVEDKSDLQEYLLNDVGCIWRGTCRHKVPMKWEFGQVYKTHIIIDCFCGYGNMATKWSH